MGPKRRYAVVTEMQWCAAAVYIDHGHTYPRTRNSVRRCTFHLKLGSADIWQCNCKWLRPEASEQKYCRVGKQPGQADYHTNSQGKQDTTRWRTALGRDCMLWLGKLAPQRMTRGRNSLRGNIGQRV